MSRHESRGYNQIYKIGDRLILEVRNRQIYEGVYGDGGKDRLALIDVIQHKDQDSIKYPGILEFYRDEIEKIHRLKCRQVEHEIPADIPGPGKQEINDKTAIQISETEYFRLKQMIKSPIHIYKVGKIFKDAVNCISQAQTISIAFGGADNQRTPEFVQLLILSTWNQIYVFDFIALPCNEEFYAWIKELLENQLITKVILDSSKLADVLDTFYNITLTNVYDLHIVDHFLQKRTEGPISKRNISECLVHYLNLPKSILERAMCTPHTCWSERPVLDKVKSTAGELGAYLLTLRDHFEKLMKQEVYDSIPLIIDYVYEMENFKFLEYNMKKVPKDIEQLIPDLNVVISFSYIT